MQAIPWCQDEFRANVERKLGAMRQVRATLGPNASFDERLALASREIDRQDFESSPDRAAAKGGSMNAPTPRGWMMNRVVDGDGADGGRTPRSNPPPSYSAEDDAFGHSEPGRKIRSSVPSVPAADPDAQAELAAQQRLLEVNQRQASKDWVILDRATVLSKLQGLPQGLTLVQLAEQLLGKLASPRDTRRLSAMMKREEIRETVSRAGRGKPIILTAAGEQELKTLDIAAEHRKSVVERQRRVATQQARLAQSLGVKAEPIPKAPGKGGK